MAITALGSASSGLSALGTQLDITSNNLANINTTGFKSFRANLEDLSYQVRAQPGVENAQGDRTPSGLLVGLGVRVSNTQQNFSQGNSVATGQPLDLMISGEGFFKVEVPPDASPDGIAYTRAGNFFTNVDGEIVLGSRLGPRIDPNITVPDFTSTISIQPDGTVTFADNAGNELGTANLEIANFVNPAGLQAIGGNLLIETEASGPPNADGEPLTPGLGSVEQGFLEGSNVDPVLELVDLIRTQRAFEFNSQSIQAADEALSVIGNIRR